MQLQITIKSVYGRNVAYPANHVAEHVALIAGTKTLTPQALRHAFEMGCTVQVVCSVTGKVTASFDPLGDDIPGDAAQLARLVSP